MSPAPDRPYPVGVLDEAASLPPMPIGPRPVPPPLPHPVIDGTAEFELRERESGLRTTLVVTTPIEADAAGVTADEMTAANDRLSALVARALRDEGWCRTLSPALVVQDILPRGEGHVLVAEYALRPYEQATKSGGAR